MLLCQNEIKLIIGETKCKWLADFGLHPQFLHPDSQLLFWQNKKYRKFNISIYKSKLYFCQNNLLVKEGKCTFVVPTGSCAFLQSGFFVINKRPVEFFKIYCYFISIRMFPRNKIYPFIFSQFNLKPLELFFIPWTI